MKYLLIFVFLYWLIRGLDLVIGILFRIPYLKKSDHSSSKMNYPKVSIIFAARNEALHINQAIEKMLMQNYPDFEVIAVNDRSNDETGMILNAINHPRLKVVHITELPKHWLGKTHALYQGYGISTGEWILFTDADVQMETQTLSMAMQAIENKQLDHLALFPKVIIKNYFENIFVSYFSLIFNMHFRTWAAQSSRSKAYVGIGAFNLVRRDVYKKIGTHQSLAMDIADDMMLGKRIKRSGFHQMAMYGYSHISVRWVDGIKGVFNSLHKNSFRGLNYNFLMLGIATLGMLLVDILPFVGLWMFHGTEFGLCAAAVGLIGLIYLSGSCYVPATILAFPAHMFSCLLFVFILWRSALSALKNNGVRWRGTVYSLKELRESSENL